MEKPPKTPDNATEPLTSAFLTKPLDLYVMERLAYASNSFKSWSDYVLRNIRMYVFCFMADIFTKDNRRTFLIRLTRNCYIDGMEKTALSLRLQRLKNHIADSTGNRGGGLSTEPDNGTHIITVQCISRRRITNTIF